MKPPRTLKRYSSNLTDTHESAEEDQNQLKKRRRKSSSLSKNDSLSSMDDTQDNLVLKYDKQGYLNCRILSSKSTRSSWARKWFFLQKGWFGICTVSTVNKEKGCIILSDRVPISECTYKVNNDSDRRYCFEVIHPKCSYYLQSEDETYMQEWLRIIKYNIDNSTYQISATPFPGALLFPLNELNNLSSSITNNDHYQPLIYMSSSLSIHPPDYSPTMLTPTLSTTSFSLTSLMINEDQSIQHTTTTTPTSSNPLPDNLKSPQLTSWTVPWLTSSLTSFSNLDDTAIDNNRQTEIDQLIVWPTKIEMNVPRPDLSHYSSQLEMRNKELRRVFSNVPQSEVVIDSFFASLSYKDTANDLSTTDGTLKLGYSGIVYITQNYLWFYSCKFMTCVNIIVLPLRCINTVQLQDAKLSKSELLLDTVFESCRPITFGIWLETPEIIYERLKVIIQNTKSESPVDIQRLYDSVRMITPTKLNKKKIPTNHVTTSSALYASVTPLTVQGQQQIYTPVMKQDISSSTANTVEENGSVGNPVHSDYPEESISSSPAQGALKAAYRKSLPANVNNQKVENKQETAIKAAESDWPKSEPASTEPANCVCDGHSDKQFNFTFDMEAKRLFDMLFGDEGRIWIEFNQLKGYGQPMISQWQTMGGGVRERTVKYIMPVSNPMVKAKETDVTDVQEILSEKEGVAYTVKVTTKTPNLPYGDAFTPYIKYCITYLTPNSCRLLCTIDVKWLRSILVKGIINRAAMKGMEETVSAIVSCVQKNLTADHRSAEMIREQNKEKPALPESMESSIQLGVNKKMAKSQQSLLYMISVGCILFMLYQLHILGQYKSRMNYYLNGGQNNTMILWRGVYLRDIEKEITENHVVLGNVNQR
ncbi:hypothetical protein BDB01DRAFT_38067 [Pilobolus umbonatus]|nr:hypothetical protein BDB01DRAFT_38067 [Pilobolus umbonatus]